MVKEIPKEISYAFPADSLEEHETVLVACGCKAISKSAHLRSWKSAQTLSFWKVRKKSKFSSSTNEQWNDYSLKWSFTTLLCVSIFMYLLITTICITTVLQQQWGVVWINDLEQDAGYLLLRSIFFLDLTTWYSTVFRVLFLLTCSVTETVIGYAQVTVVVSPQWNAPLHKCDRDRKVIQTLKW